MSVKTIWERPMRKYFFSPPLLVERKGGKGEKLKKKGKRKKRRAAVNMGWGIKMGVGAGGGVGLRGWGLVLSEMLTHSHAGLSGLFPFLSRAQRTTARPFCLSSPPDSQLGRLQLNTMLAVTAFLQTAFILTSSQSEK